MAVGTYRLLRVVAVTSGQVELPGDRNRLRRETVHSAPDLSDVGPPPTEQQAVNGGDVPTCGHAHACGDERCGGVDRPPDPPWPKCQLDLTDDIERICNSLPPSERSRREADSDLGSDGDGHEVAALETAGEQLLEQLDGQLVVRQLAGQLAGQLARHLAGQLVVR